MKLALWTLLGILALPGCGDQANYESWRNGRESASESQGAALRVMAPEAVKRRDVTYTGADGRSYPAAVLEPAKAGEYPLFVYVPGTSDPYDTRVALHIAKTMAEKGVVAVTIGYNNGWQDPAGCEAFDQKAQAVFDRTKAGSLISVLEASVPSMKTKRGVAVAGHSQGSALAGRARRYLADVRAGWLLGTGTTIKLGNLPTCLEASLPNAIKNLRAVNGEYDFFFGGPEESRVALQKITGRGFDSKSTSFFDAAGSGYHVVRALELGGFSGHNYFKDSNQNPNPVWETTSQPWGRKANQDFLLKHLDVAR